LHKYMSRSHGKDRTSREDNERVERRIEIKVNASRSLIGFDELNDNVIKELTCLLISH